MDLLEALCLFVGVFVLVLDLEGNVVPRPAQGGDRHHAHHARHHGGVRHESGVAHQAEHEIEQLIDQAVLAMVAEVRRSFRGGAE